MVALWLTMIGGVSAGLLGLELRRVARERSADRYEPRLYARYAAGDPDRPIDFAEIDAAATDAAAVDLAIIETVPEPAQLDSEQQQNAPRVGV